MDKPQAERMSCATSGRYGAMVQIGDVNDEEKPRFAKLKSTQSIETISMDEAMELFALPKVIGELDGEELSVNVGRFGRSILKWAISLFQFQKEKIYLR
ncbi:MAG: topoisomerase C-terminal repeat-containing protein [Chitinophagaceae bacterium]